LITIVTLAVMPGLSFRSSLFTSITVMYVTTFCTVRGALRTCDDFAAKRRGPGMRPLKGHLLPDFHVADVGLGHVGVDLHFAQVVRDCEN
jgi:hypothetical protein